MNHPDAVIQLPVRRDLAGHLSLQTVPSMDDPNERVIVIRTSDRYTFKLCRRLWGWTSHLKMGLVLKEEPVYFWFGNGFHWAMEDFHGYNQYGHAGKAWLAYVEACRRADCLPFGWEEHVMLGLGMLSYYTDYWLVHRDPQRTLILDGVPQVEVNSQIDLGVTYKGLRVVYGVTLDRMTLDEWGGLWVTEYKTAKAFSVYHFDHDEQITAYAWAGHKIYGEIPQGCTYLQFRKHIPQLPRLLSTGKISQDKRQPTTAALYRRMLTDMFGSVDASPADYRPFLAFLQDEEEEEADRFIRRDMIERNHAQIESFEELVLMELEDMLRDDLPLYPTKTRSCPRCPLQIACLAMDDGSDYEDTLQSYVRLSDGQFYFNKELTWRKCLPAPQEVILPQEAEMYASLIQESQEIPKAQMPDQSPEAWVYDSLLEDNRR